MPKTEDVETKVENGVAPAAPGEMSPTADQSNRDAEIASRMAMTPVRTLGQAKVEEAKKKLPKFTTDKDGERVYTDPDDLEEEAKIEEFPRDVCLNCQNHGRVNKLDDRGFCSKCGFKLNRVYNMALEPAKKV